MKKAINKIIKVKHYIPHECKECGGTGLYFSEEGQNYLYHKGKYYHKECFRGRK